MGDGAFAILTCRARSVYVFCFTARSAYTVFLVGSLRVWRPCWRAYSTRRKYKTCEEDKQLESLIAAGTECVTIVAKAWDLHVDRILEVWR